MLFRSIDEFIFGPPVAASHLTDNHDTLSEEKDKAKRRVTKDLKYMIMKGQKRVMQKVEKIRQRFSKAVVLEL